MKKTIIISMIALVSSAFAMQSMVSEDTKTEVFKAETAGMANKFSDGKLTLSKVSDGKVTSTVNNQTFLYEFNFGSMGDGSFKTKKYMTNNTQEMATKEGLQNVMKKNWRFAEGYANNMTLKSENSFGEKTMCKYSNGITIKIKSYGEYAAPCPLKS